MFQLLLGIAFILIATQGASLLFIIGLQHNKLENLRGRLNAGESNLVGQGIEIIQLKATVEAQCDLVFRVLERTK